MVLDSRSMRPRKSIKTSLKTEPIETTKGAYIVPAVDRAVRILSLLKTEGREMTIAEIADATGWHKSSVHKLLVTLAHHGLLDRDETTKRYSLGFALAGYGRIALNNLDIRHAAKTFLRALVDYTGETTILSILRETKMVIVDVEEPQIQLRVSPTVGMRTPATTTSNGKAVLAYLPEDQVSEILRIEGLPAMTKKSITKAGTMRVEMAAIRERGYAIDSEEYQEGVTAVSAPVFNSRGQAMGTLSVVGPAFRMTKDKVRNFGKKCAEMAIQLSGMLA
jgi:DNA-binding IclR family transcriptional regulator